MPVLIHYPNHPIADAELPDADPDTLREVVATCRANAIPFQLIYPQRGAFRYGSQASRRSR